MLQSWEKVLLAPLAGGSSSAWFPGSLAQQVNLPDLPVLHTHGKNSAVFLKRAYLLECLCLCDLLVSETFWQAPGFQYFCKSFFITSLYTYSNLYFMPTVKIFFNVLLPLTCRINSFSCVLHLARSSTFSNFLKYIFWYLFFLRSLTTLLLLLLLLEFFFPQMAVD